MPNQDPFGKIDGLAIRVATAALTLTATVSLIGREWHDLIDHGPYLEGILGTLVGTVIVLAVRRMRN